MFKKYDSLENAYRQKYVDKCAELGVKEWVATEKLHGANFGFIVDESGAVTPMKRTSILTEDEISSFYGCADVVSHYRPKVRELAEMIGGPIIVYGELCGDGVQKNVDYGPKDFAMFDILLSNTGEWVGWDNVKHLGVMNEIPYVPEIARGTLEELLKISPEFSSLYAKSNNRECEAEGLVIKQLKNEKRLTTGERGIIKNKSAKFSEKKNVKPKTPFKLPEELQPIAEEFCSYLNDNRVNAVVSKIGKIEQKDFGKVLGLLIQDAKEDFEKDNDPIEKDDWKLVMKVVNKEAASVIRNQWLNLIDGV